ncbi:von Willebrand factor type A domain-containing protein [Actinopolymorpha sp. B17G11]|uniref:YfbK domain-containing protein n=1 Tax=Actinopolymorpha sp. B17G11 TaxID=3160861 RepID=UPI0032E3FFAA
MKGHPAVTQLRTAIAVTVSAALLLLAGCSGDTAPGAAGSEGRERAAPGEAGKSAPGGGSAYDGNSGAAPMAPQGGAAPESGLRADGDAAVDSRAVRPYDDNLSTFGLDVDTASYDYARRVLSDGSLPDPAQVRPEEFINAFAQDYPQPTGDGIGVHTDGFRLPAWGGPRVDNGGIVATDTRLMRVGLQTRAERYGTRPNAHLTFVVDVSGSMREPGRLDLVQDALHTLIDQLRPSDAVAIVAYSTQARVIQEMTPVWERADLHQAVDQLAPEDSTNLEAGLVAGYRVARDGFGEGVANRVILLSDGLANTGNVTHEGILAQVRESAGKDIALLCVGVGREYGDQLMEQLADNGEGFAVYVSQVEQARRLFVDRLPGTLSVRARDAKAQVAFNPENVAGYQLIGFENRAVADQDFRNDAVDGGEVGPGHSVTALYVVNLRPGAHGEVATATARWLSPRTGAADEAQSVVSVADLDLPYAAASTRLRLDYVAATFAVCLRGAGYGVVGSGREYVYGCGGGVVYDRGDVEPDGALDGGGAGFDGRGDGLGGHGGVGGDVPPGHPLPGPSVPELVSWQQLAAEADALAAATEDPDAATLAGLIHRAGELI